MKKRIGMNLRFAATPPAGLAILYDDQRYDLIGRAELLTWSSNCKTCGEQFECSSTLEIHWLTRNCEQHRQRSFGQRRSE